MLEVRYRMVGEGDEPFFLTGLLVFGYAYLAAERLNYGVFVFLAEPLGHCLVAPEVLVEIGIDGRTATSILDGQLGRVGIDDDGVGVHARTSDFLTRSGDAGDGGLFVLHDGSSPRNDGKLFTDFFVRQPTVLRCEI